jgi:hypothetical protein
MQSVESKLTYRTWNLDGVTYTLAILVTCEGFCGAWLCDSCCIFGYPDVITESFEDALKETKLSAAAHQRSAHFIVPVRTPISSTSVECVKSPLELVEHPVRRLIEAA